MGYIDCTDGTVIIFYLTGALASSSPIRRSSRAEIPCPDPYASDYNRNASGAGGVLVIFLYLVEFGVGYREQDVQGEAGQVQPKHSLNSQATTVYTTAS